MNRIKLGYLLKIYNYLGRFGNIILLALLIVFGLLNRFYMAVRYGYPDYIVEIALIIIAFFFVYRIISKNIHALDRRRLIKILLIIGIVLRVLLAAHDFYDRPVQESDYLKHEKLGARIAFEGKFYDFCGVELRNYRQPGLPVLFALGLRIYNSPIVYALVMILFSFGALIAGYYLFRGLKNITAFFSFAYLAISPNVLFMASISNTQLPFFFFLLLLLILLKNYNGKIYQLLIIGALLACEVYIRLNFLMIFLLIPFIIEKHKELGISNPILKIAVIYLSFLILYSPWGYRNYLIYGTKRFLPTAGPALYSVNVNKDHTKLGGYNGVPDSVIKKYSNLSEVDFDNALRKETINFLKNNPDIYIKGIPFRFFKYSGRQDWTIGYFWGKVKFLNSKLMGSIFQSIENFFFWVVLLFPFIFLLKRKMNSPLSVYLLWSYLSYSMVLLPILETRARYNFPYILFPLFAAAFYERKKLLPQ